jgi:hypothetical protein
LHGTLQGFLLVCAPGARHPLGGGGWRAAYSGTFQVAVRTLLGRRRIQ